MKKYILLLAITLVSVHTWAQENRTKTLINAALHGWEYELKAGFNIGGTLPLPFPEEIRNIKSYNPTLSITIEGNMSVGGSLPDFAWRIKVCVQKQK